MPTSSRRNRTRGGPGRCALLVAACALLGGASPPPEETVRLKPDEPAGWRPRDALSWLRPGYYHGARSIRIETAPAGALLDLFYVRSNFQKRYRQIRAPVRVILPSRAEAGARDAVRVRASLAGYRTREVSIRVDSDRDHVRVELEPVPNVLEAVSHVYFAGRTSLVFLTREVARLKVLPGHRSFQVILAETAEGPTARESLAGIRSPVIERVNSLTVGADLLVRVRTRSDRRGEALELRSRRSRAEPRDLFVQTVELVPSDGGGAALERARAGLAGIGPAQVSGCAAAFDEALRRSLDPAELSRALAPRGAFTDPYLRAAMRRLGELSTGGRIAMLDGSRLDAARPIELAVAMSQPEAARGYLALLRSFVAALEEPRHRPEVLRSLVAPELGASRFAEILGVAERAEGRCQTDS